MKAVKFSSILGLALLLGVLLAGTVSYSNGQLTGDEILQRADDQQEVVMGGELISMIRFDNVYSDGTTGSNIFASLSKAVEGQPDRSLIYFKEPDDVKGSLFLSIDPVDPDEDTKLFLYLPALGQVKELISEEERSRSFAGSTLSYSQVGEREMTDDYTAELVGEESITVDDESYSCYLLELTAKPEADADYSAGKSWVEKGNWLTLKGEYYNESGNLEQTMEVLKIGEFEGNVVTDEMISRDVLEGSSTTISFLDRRRPEGEIPDSVFDPENLANFDPVEWGFED